MRADKALVARGLARSRARAVELIRTGRVRLDGRELRRPSEPATDQQELTLAGDQGPALVSRAGEKLRGALLDSQTEVPPGARVLDAGACTGGFTHVLLTQPGPVQRVYAVDVGHGQLAPELRCDPRVVVREGVNLRELSLAHLDGEPVDLLVADVSFISLTLLLKPMLGVLRPQGTALLLVKPQFEVGRARLGKGGVVRSEADRHAAVEAVVAVAAELSWQADWRGDSRLAGRDGNRETFVRLRSEPQGVSRVTP